MHEIERVEWVGCYDGSWDGLMVPEAFAHPAKISSGLAQRIYMTMFERGWLAPRMTVLDPFGGVAGTAFHGLLLGCNWAGVELEPKFVAMGAGCDCTGISWFDYEMHRDAWDKVTHAGGRHWCPACLAQAKAGPPAQGGLFDQPEAGEWFTPPHHYVGNLELWRAKYRPQGRAVLKQGDSRFLRQVLAATADAALSSPPYADGAQHTGGPTRTTSGQGGEIRFVDFGDSTGQLQAMPVGDLDAAISSPPYSETRIDGQGDEGSSGLRAADGSYLRGAEGWAVRKAMGGRYGDQTGNLGNLPAGDLDAALSSPPYASSVNQSAGANDSDARIERKRAAGIDVTKPVNLGGPNSSLRQAQAYGESEGQLGAMPAGDLDAALSSPPYGGIRMDGGNDEAEFGPASMRPYTGEAGDTWFTQRDQRNLGNLRFDDLDRAISSPPYGETDVAAYDGGMGEQWRATGQTPRQRSGGKLPSEQYGEAAGQLGGAGADTFWAAARQIVAETYALLKPGGVAAWVTGDFVRDRRRVPFGQQWLALCESVGFEPLLWAVAWKSEDHGRQLGIFGEGRKLGKERVSFFRRLANEKNPETAIRNEDVIFVRKPEVARA